MLHVLSVDDEYPTLEALRIMLDWNALGCCEPDSATNGMEALALMREKHYDIVITDIRMPGMDGLAFMRTLRDIKSDVKIVVVTGYDTFSYAQEAIRCGVKDYFLKPIDRYELTECIRKLVSEVLYEHEGRAEKAPVAPNDGNLDIATVAAYLDNCFRHEISVKELGDLFHVNPAYLGQQFHKEMRCTVKDYINRKRIDWIKSMILSGQRLTQQTIEQAGYRNSGYFYRKFQESEGVTFAQWRQSLKEEPTK